MSSQAFSLSFDSPAMASKVPSLLSQIFFSNVHHIQIMPYKQRLPVRQLEENVFLPPVVPSGFFLTLLPLF